MCSHPSETLRHAPLVSDRCKGVSFSNDHNHGHTCILGFCRSPSWAKNVPNCSCYALCDKWVYSCQVVALEKPKLQSPVPSGYIVVHETLKLVEDVTSRWIWPNASIFDTRAIVSASYSFMSNLVREFYFYFFLKNKKIRDHATTLGTPRIPRAKVVQTLPTYT